MIWYFICNYYLFYFIYIFPKQREQLGFLLCTSKRIRSMFLADSVAPPNSNLASVASVIKSHDFETRNMILKHQLWKTIEILILTYQIWWKTHAGVVFNTPGASKWQHLLLFKVCYFFIDDKCQHLFFFNTNNKQAIARISGMVLEPQNDVLI